MSVLESVSGHGVQMDGAAEVVNLETGMVVEAGTSPADTQDTRMALDATPADSSLSTTVDAKHEFVSRPELGAASSAESTPTSNHPSTLISAPAPPSPSPSSSPANSTSSLDINATDAQPTPISSAHVRQPSVAAAIANFRPSPRDVISGIAPHVLDERESQRRRRRRSRRFSQSSSSYSSHSHAHAHSYSFSSSSSSLHGHSGYPHPQAYYSPSGPYAHSPYGYSRMREHSMTYEHSHSHSRSNSRSRSRPASLRRSFDESTARRYSVTHICESSPLRVSAVIAVDVDVNGDEVLFLDSATSNGHAMENKVEDVAHAMPSLSQEPHGPKPPIPPKSPAAKRFSLQRPRTAGAGSSKHHHFTFPRSAKLEETAGVGETGKLEKSEDEDEEFDDKRSVHSVTVPTLRSRSGRRNSLNVKMNSLKTGLKEWRLEFHTQVFKTIAGKLKTKA